MKRGDFVQGYLIGLIEGRGVFGFRIDDRSPAFSFRLELPIVRKETIRFVKNHFNFGTISNQGNSVIFSVNNRNDLASLIEFINRGYFIASQKFILFKCWETIFNDYRSLQIENKNISQRDFTIFTAYAREFRALLKSNKKRPSIKITKRKNPIDQFGFLCGLIDTKGFLDFRIYSEQKSDRAFPHSQPRFSFYLTFNRYDLKLARLFKKVWQFGKIYKQIRTLQFHVAARDDVWKFSSFMEKYFSMKPRIIEFRIWASIFYNMSKYKDPTRGSRYTPYHMSFLYNMAHLYNKKRRIYLSAKKLSALVEKIDEEFVKLSDRHALADEKITYFKQKF